MTYLGFTVVEYPLYGTTASVVLLSKNNASLIIYQIMSLQGAKSFYTVFIFELFQKDFQFMIIKYPLSRCRFWFVWRTSPQNHSGCILSKRWVRWSFRGIWSSLSRPRSRKHPLNAVIQWSQLIIVTRTISILCMLSLYSYWLYFENDRIASKSFVC